MLSTILVCLQISDKNVTGSEIENYVSVIYQRVRDDSKADIIC